MENAESKQLTPSDPVSKDVLAALETLSTTQQQVAVDAMECERERIACVRKYNAIETEKMRLIERALIERGLSPTAPVSIDQATGVITMLRDGAPAPEAPAGG